MIYHLILDHEPPYEGYEDRWFCSAVEYNGIGMYSQTLEGAVRNFMAMLRDCPEPGCHRTSTPDLEQQWFETGNVTLYRIDADTWWWSGWYEECWGPIEPAPYKPGSLETEFCE